MLPDQVSNPGPLTYKSGALPIALRGPEVTRWANTCSSKVYALKALGGLDKRFTSSNKLRKYAN